ncbi:MICOS complex subunit MIC27 isoform X1 [Fundulus heteroclitus]|uniref:MICOS complex subunit MIC27 isoform X1 n=1 Tax=Fundulus heteroclitus TaxID=8078 RepID=UPI00165AA27E|nr:MICOS complex subunit MIC27 isoform X1 [Fundulus heteroclitus]
MAAKVVMVAVPTVLGIASVRVYRVKEAPTDGLVSRDVLNIYTPLSGAASPQLAPESPGFIERGLTVTRESVSPLVQAVKGACVSIKRGSVNLYHAGEDVYYYVIDPPPDFLPRFGTITMAGLLGMFLARKGSRFKRVAVPLGLMSAGASVCYPAQAVSVLKVTGKKAYAAGQWSSAAASSLLATKKAAAAAPPQPSPEADAESAVTEEASANTSTSDTSSKSSAGLERGAESAEPVSISDEQVVTVTTEEELPAAPAGASPTETGTAITGPPADGEPAQTEPSRPSEGAAEGQKASDGKRASDGVSFDATPADPSASSELERVQDGSAAAITADEPAASPSVAEAVSAEEQSLPAVKETASSPPAGLPPPQEPAAGNRKEGSGFKPDPTLMDFGQSSPEDEDLYSTRS